MTTKRLEGNYPWRSWGTGCVMEQALFAESEKSFNFSDMNFSEAGEVKLNSHWVMFISIPSTAVLVILSSITFVKRVQNEWKRETFRKFCDQFFFFLWRTSIKSRFWPFKYHGSMWLRVLVNQKNNSHHTWVPKAPSWSWYECLKRVRSALKAEIRMKNV